MIYTAISQSYISVWEVIGQYSFDSFWNIYFSWIFFLKGCMKKSVFHPKMSAMFELVFSHTGSNTHSRRVMLVVHVCASTRFRLRHQNRFLHNFQICKLVELGFCNTQWCNDSSSTSSGTFNISVELWIVKIGP